MYLQTVRATCSVCASLLDFHRVWFNHENGSFRSPFHITWNFPKFQHKSNSRFELHFKCNSLVITWIAFYTVLYFLKSSDHMYTKYCRMEKEDDCSCWLEENEKKSPLLAFCFRVLNAPWLWSRQCSIWVCSWGESAHKIKSTNRKAKNKCKESNESQQSDSVSFRSALNSFSVWSTEFERR